MLHAVKAALEKRERAIRKAYAVLLEAQANALALQDGQEGTEENPDPTEGVLGQISDALVLLGNSGCQGLPTTKEDN